MKRAALPLPRLLALSPALAAGALALGDPAAAYESAFNRISTAISPADPVNWMINASNVLLRTGIYEWISLTAAILFAIAIVNIGHVVQVAGWRAGSRLIFRLFFALLVYILTAFPTYTGVDHGGTSTHHRLLMLWPKAYLSAINSSYVGQASTAFNEAINDLLRTTFIYGGVAFTYASVIDGAFAGTTAAGKAARRAANLSEAGGTTNLITQSPASALSAALRAPARQIYRLLGTNFALFLAMGLMYSILLTLTGTGYLFAMMLMPLAAALYMFAPTARLLGRIISAAISMLVLTILLPALLALALNASITRNLEVTDAEMARFNSMSALTQKVAQLVQDEVEAAYTTCISRGGIIVGATPVTASESYTDPRTGATTILQYTYHAITPLAFPDRCRIDEETRAMSPEEREQTVYAHLIEATPLDNATFNRSLVNTTLTMVVALLATLLSAALAFFIFLGTVNVTTQMIAGISIGGALENPLL